MYAAAWIKTTKSIKALIECGAKVNTKDSIGWISLHFACSLFGN